MDVGLPRGRDDVAVVVGELRRGGHRHGLPARRKGSSPSARVDAQAPGALDPTRPRARDQVGGSERHDPVGTWPVLRSTRRASSG